MPKQKDLKRLTRARMQKTGESYTAARATLLAKKARRSARREDVSPAPAPPPAAAPDYAALAGMSDATVEAKTGCTWERWVAALDYQGAAEWSHGEIAAHVHEKYEIPGWWAQTVTVGYERIKGLRAIGQRRDGGYEANKSKTVPAPVERLRRAVTDGRVRARWLPDAKPTQRKTTSEQSARFTWEDGTAVVFWFVAKGDGKSQVAVTHQKLASKADAEAKKAYWGERLAALAELLKAEAAAGA
jgi:hypothetical protein